MQFSRKVLLLVFVVTALLAAPPAVIAKKAIFTLTDPRGDDHGDGNYIYPDNNDLDPGQLDILSFQAVD